ncbi:hypothetical protein BDK51DRAFT_26537, partial [Blyttiomyces helicus]
MMDDVDFNSDDEVSDLEEEEEKYEEGEETLQLGNNSAPAAVYDRGVRDEEEGRKSDNPEKVFGVDGKEIAEGLINGQVTKRLCVWRIVAQHVGTIYRGKVGYWRGH